MIPPVRRPQIFGVVAVLAVFILVEFVVGEHGRAPTVLSNEAQGTPTR
ncbi:MAG TPA: hypothetical protein VGM96_09495 [Reyranella sp.]